jgi:hypothetical protein
MKYPVKRFKDMRVALQELEPFVRNGAHLQTGKPFENFGGMRSREVLANWLLCTAVNAACDCELAFSSDPIDGDGIIFDMKTNEVWPTEHVMVPRLRPGQIADADSLILKQIELKRKKGGEAYAQGLTLVVFLDAGAGTWHPNSVAKRLPNPLLFATVWVVGLQRVDDDGAYIYGVTNLDLSEGDVPVFLVRIAPEFDAWQVTRIQ